jgi:hypothetical protein
VLQILLEAIVVREDCDNWKRKVVVLFLALLCLIGGGCEGTGAAKEPLLPPDSKPVQLQQGQKVFPYYNPVYPGDGPDPALLRQDPVKVRMCIHLG